MRLVPDQDPAKIGDLFEDYVKKICPKTVELKITRMAWAPVISFIQSVLGVDRVLYAMDYPYQFEISEVIASDDVPMSAEDKTKFFQTNAERVFALT